MFNKFAIFFLVFLSVCYLYAQTNNITGVVIESETREPMQYANILLSDDVDSTMVDGTTTDINGNFRFDNIEDGKYYLTISFIGFEKVQSPIFTHKGNTYIGKIAINKSSILLDEVSITGEKSTLVSTLDKKIYNVGKDIISESGSISEILNNVPSVSVDVNGNVTLRGTSNITFLINGRPSSLLRRNAPAALQQISANSIERIEVITNPSAKFSPEGTGGIINIIQRKDSELGINGQIIGNIGNEKRYNTTFLLNYNHEGLNSYLSYSPRTSAGSNVYSDKRTKKELSSGLTSGIYNESGSTKSEPWAHIFDAGITYQFDEENLVEISGTYFLQNSLHKGFSDITEINNQNQLISRLRSENTNDEFESEGEGGIAFEHIFGGNEDHSLVIEGAYANYSERETLNFRELYTYPEIDNSRNYIRVNKGGDQTEIISEYALPINRDSDFEAGYTGEFINDDIAYLNNRDASRFLFKQNVHSLYAIYARDFNKFSMEVGLRAEQVLINSHLISPTDLLIENDYFKMYPSLSLAYEIRNNQNIMISYSKRINRPDADQLNPYAEFTDPRNGEAGNPNLKPEQIHSFELSYQVIGEPISFTSSLFYRYKYDAFTAISNLIGDSTVISTVTNLSKQQFGGVELITSGGIQKWWDYNLTTSLYYNEINATNLGYSDNKGTISGSAKLYSLIRLAKTTFLQFNLNYDSPVLTPQGQMEHIFYLNAGFRQLILNNQVALTFTISDVFSTYDESRNINIPELNQITSLRRNEPVMYFGFSWRFGESFQNNESELEFESEGLRKI